MPEPLFLFPRAASQAEVLAFDWSIKAINEEKGAGLEETEGIFFGKFLEKLTEERKAEGKEKSNECV